MPHIVVHLSGQPDADLTRQTVDAVAELTQSCLLYTSPSPRDS